MIKKDMVALHKVEKGTKVRLAEIPKGKSKALLVRLGLVEGTLVRCIEHLPGGTMVIEKHRQEIAIGAALAKEIFVVPQEA
jgi:Fe2+ transport system protein FeoA